MKKNTGKPVRRCYSCLLNMDSHCWLYDSPREMWHSRKTCPSFENPEDYKAFELAQKQPEVRTRRDLRREYTWRSAMARQKVRRSRQQKKH